MSAASLPATPLVPVVVDTHLLVWSRYPVVSPW